MTMTITLSKLTLGARASWLTALLIASTGVQAQTPAAGAVPVVPSTTPRVDFGLEWDLSLEDRRNFDLDRTRERDRRVRENELALSTTLTLNPAWTVSLEGIGLTQARHTQGSAPEHQDRFERGEAVLRYAPVGSPWTIEFGRLSFVDARTWWWDENLDALRLRWQAGSTTAQVALARELAPLASNQHGLAADVRGVTRLLAQLGWAWSPKHQLEVFALLQDDRSGVPAAGSPWRDDRADPSDLDAGWLGLRASGEGSAGTALRVSYWGDLGLVQGRESRSEALQDAQGGLTAGPARRVTLRGHAVDLGATLALRGLAAKPWFTLAYAAGSGGATGSTDRTYRASGLQEQRARLGGSKRMRYYGELLRPALGNLRVATIGSGLRLFDRSSVELLWHDYRQRHAADHQAGLRLSADPGGLDPRLGQAWDVLFAWREHPGLDLSLGYSRFQAGPAFPTASRDPASSVELGLTLNF